jgi:hypothetical protein
VEKLWLASTTHQPHLSLTFVSQVVRSSAFEGMLLKATWPGDEAVPQDILTEIIKHSIPAFKYGRSVIPRVRDSPFYSILIFQVVDLLIAFFVDGLNYSRRTMTLIT